MNKKFIALVSSIAFALAPATTVLAEGDGQGYTPSAGNNSEVTDVYYFSSAENRSDVSTTMKSDNKNVGAQQLNLKGGYVQALIKEFKLGNKKVVDAFELFADEKATYSITFSNKAVYLDGHVYRVHHYSYDESKHDYFEKEASEVTAKNGSITVTLHGASPVLIEDLGVAKSAETAVSKDGRKAALKTGVEY